MEGFEKKHFGTKANLTIISAERSVSGLKQFSELFKRTLQNLFRNTRTIISAIVSPFAIVLFVLSLYWKICDVDLTDDNIELDKTRRSMH